MTVNWRELVPFLQEADRRALNCNVILVNQPQRYDLLQLPRDELARVDEALGGLAPELSGAAAVAWEETTGRIRSQLDDPVELVVSSVVLTSRPVDSAVQERLRSLLLDAYDAEPLVLEAEDGVVCSVDEPEWARWLGADTFVGRVLDDLGGVLADRFGPQSVRWLVSPLHGVVVLSSEFDAPHGRRDLRVHRLVDGASGRQRVFVVEVDPGTPAPAPV
jgi:hypothetical protein